MVILPVSRRFVLAVVAAVGLLACRPPPAAYPIAAANRGATFEVRLTGCSTVGAAGRRFGPNLRAALLWSSERVHTGSLLPCTATIDAVRGSDRHAVYRVSRTRDGAYVEELVHRQP
jgi:hypothetical protein